MSDTLDLGCDVRAGVAWRDDSVDVAFDLPALAYDPATDDYTAQRRLNVEVWMTPAGARVLARALDPQASPLVLVCSPYAGDIEAHTAYARRCLLDSIERGEVPIAPHLLYPQVLDEHDPTQREAGIALSLALIPRCERVVAYVDRGLSGGMCAERDAAFAAGVPWEQRRIGR